MPATAHTIRTETPTIQELKAEEKLRHSEEHSVIRLSHTQEALRLSEDKFYKAFHHNQNFMAIVRLIDGIFIDINNSAAKVMGYSREDIVGKNDTELGIHRSPKSQQLLEQLKQQIIENNCLRDVEYELITKSGKTIYLLSNVSSLEIDGEKCLLISSVNITERKKAEENLRLSQELFSKTFNANPLAMSITSRKSREVLNVNEAYILQYGYSREELIGEKTTEIGVWMDKNDYDHFLKEILQNGHARNLEMKFRKKSGEVVTVLLSGIIINFQGKECVLETSSDITQLRLCQNEIARLERLNLVGEMAAGISHEIRNPLTTVRGFLQLLGGKDRYAEDKKFMDLMINELDRANSIITRYLFLAKDKSVEFEKQDLNETIKSLFPPLQSEAISQEKTIILALGDIPQIIMDKSDILQLIINLSRNGLEATPPGGMISISTYMDKHTVVLAVQDQGSGIDHDVLEKMGTPFFTTKDHGTGLGLAICYSIAQRHNAKIDVETSPNGSTFYVRFSVPGAAE